jgi:hypothetical protein
MVAVCQEAVETARSALIGAGSGRITSGIENRRASSGPVDTELGILRIVDESDSPIATLVNFACHPTFLGHQNRLISADYPGFAAARIRAATGAVALFTTGAEGDVGPVPERRRAYNPIEATNGLAAAIEQPTRPAFERAEALGTAIGDEALRVLPSMPLGSQGAVRVATETVDLPLLAPPTEEGLEELRTMHRAQVAAAHETSNLPGAKVHGAMLGWVDEILEAVRSGQAARTVPAEAQVITLGSVRIVGVPGEAFVRIGQAIKSHAGDDTAFVVGYANDDIGYIPTPEEYVRGGYEIHDAYKYYGYPAALAPEAGQVFVSRVAELLKGHENCSRRVPGG